MQDELFSDGIGDITITGSIVRIDLVSLSPNSRDAKGVERPVFRQRVVMPLEGFVRSFSAFEQVMQRLHEAGVLERREEGSQPAPRPAPAEREMEIAAPLPRSPNFG
ncbi:MAG TPA: hypothetical protein VEB64_08435 [Azospirillaceae bacterium]|nr:hypothetical protein [Azospirillaceae bacterium]